MCACVWVCVRLRSECVSASLLQFIVLPKDLCFPQSQSCSLGFKLHLFALWPPLALPHERTHGKDAEVFWFLFLLWKTAAIAQIVVGAQRESDGSSWGWFLHLSLMLAQSCCWAKTESTINQKHWAMLHNSAVTKQQFMLAKITSYKGIIILLKMYIAEPVILQ